MQKKRILISLKKKTVKKKPEFHESFILNKNKSNVNFQQKLQKIKSALKKKLSSTLKTFLKENVQVIFVVFVESSDVL